MGTDVSSLSDEDIQKMVAEGERRFREEAPKTAAAAATVILDGVKADRWRILAVKTLSGSTIWFAARRNALMTSTFSRASQPKSAGAYADKSINRAVFRPRSPLSDRPPQ